MKTNTREHYMNRQIARLDELNPQWRDAMEAFWALHKEQLQEAYLVEQSKSFFERATHVSIRVENMVMESIDLHFKRLAQRCFFNPRRILGRANLTSMFDLYRILCLFFWKAKSENLNPLSLVPSSEQLETFYSRLIPYAISDQVTEACQRRHLLDENPHCQDNLDGPQTYMIQLASTYFEVLHKIDKCDQSPHSREAIAQYREVPLLSCKKCGSTPFEYMKTFDRDQNYLDHLDVLKVCQNFVMLKLADLQSQTPAR